MSGKLRCVSGPAELFGKTKEKPNDRVFRRTAHPVVDTPPKKHVQPRARPPTTQRPPMKGNVPPPPKDLPDVGFEVWGAPPPPPPGVSSGESSGFHGWSHIHDPKEAAAMHRELIEHHYASLTKHFNMMWHHQNMANMAGAAAEGRAPPRLAPPQLPLPPPPVMFPDFDSTPFPAELRGQPPSRTDRRDGDDDQNSQGLTDVLSNKDSSKDTDSSKDSDA